MLCHLKFGLFIFFAFCVVVMSIIYKFLPKTKGVPIEEMAIFFWKNDPYWSKYVSGKDPDHEMGKEGRICLKFGCGL